MKLLLLQLLAHVISDFYFQTNKSCQDKEEKGLHSKQLYIHALITFVSSWLLSFTFEFWWMSLIISCLHFVVDGLKSNFKEKKYVFFIDQLIHISIITVICYFANVSIGLSMPSWLPNDKTVAIILGIGIVIKPANIFIREVLKLTKIALPTQCKNSDELPNAGKLIGSVERLLALTFTLLGQYEAIGFIIAAKSILRFAEKDTAKTEYVLVGTLLSFAIAIFVGLSIKFVLSL